MIVETILNMFLSFASILIDELPSLNIDATIQTFDTFFEYVDVAAYFIPMDTVTGILKVIIAEEAFKIGLSIVKLIWHFIPVVGA